MPGNLTLFKTSFYKRDSGAYMWPVSASELNAQSREVTKYWGIVDKWNVGFGHAALSFRQAEVKNNKTFCCCQVDI